jgi:hypothetical protein
VIVGMKKSASHILLAMGAAAVVAALVIQPPVHASMASGTSVSINAPDKPQPSKTKKPSKGSGKTPQHKKASPDKRSGTHAPSKSKQGTSRR